MIQMYKRFTYKLFGWYRYDVILERGVIPILDIQKMYEDIKCEEVLTDIEKLKKELDEAMKQEKLLVDNIQSFQKTVEYATYELMLKLISLREELLPEEKESMEELKDFFNRVKNGESPKDDKPKKLNKQDEDKRIKKLYMKLARIYHPDKAPKGKEAEYAEIFKTLSSLRELGDYERLKSYARTLKKAVKKNKLELKSLKKLRANLLKDIEQKKAELRDLEKSPIYNDYLEYKENPSFYIEKQKLNIKTTIKGLEAQLKQKNSIFDGFNTSGPSIW